MADITGLVIGTVALASLFSTCVELFERFELGRNYVYDYDLACTKLCLLKTRLTAWGISLNIESPGHEHLALRRCWTEEQDVVGRSLLGIREIFQNASILAERYKLTQKRSRSFRSTALLRSKIPHLPSTDEQEWTQATTKSWALLRKRTSWAIHDKQKFDSLIQDLSFLIENLEKVIERLPMPSPSFKEQMQQVKERMEQDWQLKKDQSSDIAPTGQKVLPSNHSGSQLGQVGLQDVAKQLDGHVFAGDQTVERLGIVGTVGDQRKRHIYTTNQHIKKGGFGVMGDMDRETALNLDHQRSLDENSRTGK